MKFLWYVVNLCLSISNFKREFVAINGIQFDEMLVR